MEVIMFFYTMLDHVYDTHIILLAGNRAEIKDVVLGIDPTFDGDMDFVGRCIEVKAKEPNGQYRVVIMLPEWLPHLGRPKPNAESISVLAHELFHATEFVMWQHDIEHNKETQEAWAYYFDSLLRRALEVLL